ncbi:MAG: hypothetical protein KatS3mg104_2916 [Phycisphaerae bacterium]|nr:MAG: hypothetical protein KatS3mg104_2916 [Phycisphaerae bacterium]
MDGKRAPAFPLARIELALLEQPRSGRYFNTTLSQTSFWVAFAVIFTIHFWNGLGACLKDYFPGIPIRYDLSRLLAGPPFSFVTRDLASATLYVSVVGGDLLFVIARWI